MLSKKKPGGQKSRPENNIVKKIGIMLFWLAVWQVLTWCVGNRILLAGPIDTLRAFTAGLQDGEFYKTILFSLCRIGAGFGFGVLAGSLLGAFGYRFRLLREILSPMMMFFKTVPVASFVVLLLIWWGSKGLSVAVVFIVVLPIVYTSVVQGLMAADIKMLEVAEVFHMPSIGRFFYIYRPALKPFIDSAMTICLGMSWKSGVAAEVIGTPAFSIGEQMYMTKIYLDTSGLFAWTATVVLLSFLFEKICLCLWKKFCLWKPAWNAMPERTNREKSGKRNAGVETADTDQLVLEKMCKSFDGKRVLENVNKNLEKGKIYCLMAPSGAGKTTLLRILAGLEQADGGEMTADGLNQICTVCFQEDRLAEQYTAMDNILMVVGSRRKAEAKTHLLRLLPEEALTQNCNALSGGMKRRVSLVRAVMAESEILLLDEPFAGLDEENKKKCAEYILVYQQERTVIVATHDEADATWLGGEIWKL